MTGRGVRQTIPRCAISACRAKSTKRSVGASVDTAARDIKDLVDKGVLTDPGNKLRNIAYGIVISPDSTLWPASDDTVISTE